MMTEWKMVPVEPTDNQTSAAITAFEANATATTERGYDITLADLCAAYRAMLAAAPEPPPDPSCDDSVVEASVAMLRSRSRVGVEKYGTTLAASPEDFNAFLRHLAEELGDALNYVMKLRAGR